MPGQLRLVNPFRVSEGNKPLTEKEMKKITPEMLGKMPETIKVPEYDWDKQSRDDAFGTWQSTSYNQNTYSGQFTWSDRQSDSYTD